MATTYRIVHQPDATPETPYNVARYRGGSMTSALPGTSLSGTAHSV